MLIDIYFSVTKRTILFDVTICLLIEFRFSSGWDGKNPVEMPFFGNVHCPLPRYPEILIKNYQETPLVECILCNLWLFPMKPNWCRPGSVKLTFILCGKIDVTTHRWSNAQKRNTFAKFESAVLLPFMSYELLSLSLMFQHVFADY